MIYIRHAYPEASHRVSGTVRHIGDNHFLVKAQPPTLIELVDKDDTKRCIVITNNYDDKVYPLT